MRAKQFLVGVIAMVAPVIALGQTNSSGAPEVAEARNVYESDLNRRLKIPHDAQ